MADTQQRDNITWRARAEECRALAQTFSNPETRRKMLAVASDYERMAATAQHQDVAPPETHTKTG